MAIATTIHHTAEYVPSRRPLLPAGWPLSALYLLFPLWWLFGLSHFIFLILSVVMAWELLRRRPVYAPLAFGLWLLLLLVVAAGAFLLWVQPPGTVPVSGIHKLIPFIYRFAWYGAITVVALYVLNMSEEELPTERVMRLLSWMFVFTLVGGIAGLTFPHVNFPSLLELAFDFVKRLGSAGGGGGGVSNRGFVYSLIHPSIVSASDFLGYEQPRPTAPFAYANAWGNNLGLFLPFFVGSWLKKGAGWHRPVGVVLLLVAIVPIAYSLNRGLWIGLIMGGILVAVRLASWGRLRVLQVSAGLLIVGAIIFVFSPLYDTVTLRVATPHSNDRRGTVAEEVIGKTAELSPLLGYGDTRTVTGSFESIAGGETPDCHQCAAPPLGTQGFVWRLIFTTGLLGTLLFVGFVGGQFIRFIRIRDPVALIGCTVILMGMLFSFVYDSLESPLYTIMIGIALMNRRFLPGRRVGSTGPAEETR